MSDPDVPIASPEAPPRWPGTVGVIGVVVGVLMVLDQVDDLLILLFWSEAEWSRLVGRELAEFLVRALPARGLLVAGSLIKLALGALLVTASLRLRHRRRSGVTLCRTWAALAAAWLVVEMGWAVIWLSQHAGEIPGLPAVGWQGSAGCGIALALAILLAWPVFLLAWFARPAIREQVAAWPG